MKKYNKEILDEAYNLAFKYEANYGNCPQCVLRAIQEVFGLNMDTIIKAAHSLAGGLALSGNGSCGALAGGAMALSLVYGRALKDMDKGRFLEAQVLVKRLYDKFVEEFGSCVCRDVQQKIFGKSFNLWDPEEYKEFETMGGHRDKCPEVTGKVARWVAEILLQEKVILGGRP